MTELNAPGNWEFFDLHNFGSKVNGYAESVFDGRFVYYGPERNYTKDGVSFEAHCFFLRFDTQKPFSDPNSWQLFDGREIYHLASGSVGLAFDGRFIYYVPFRSGGANKYLLNSVILRYDITKNYLDKKSWEYFDLSCIDSDAGGFVGSCFFNGKIYMAPYYSGDKSLFLVYNTKHAFCSKTSWEKNDLLKINQNAKGYIGCLGIKKYIYFSPCYNDQKENSHGFSVD